MKIVSMKKELNEGISLVSKAINGKTTIPMLEGIYMEVKDGKLTLIGSDMDLSIEVKIDVEVIANGSIVIDAKIFSEIIRRLPDDAITLELVDDNTLKITCQKSEFNVVVKSALDYPQLPAVVEQRALKLPQNQLKNMVKSVSFAVAQDDARPMLQGVLFEAKDRILNMVAMDGYRLAHKYESVEFDDEVSAIIPAKTLNEVAKVIGDGTSEIELGFSSNHVIFKINDVRITSRLLEGKYINYRSLLPTEHKLDVDVAKDALKSSIERASLMASRGDSTNLVKMLISEDSLLISSNSQLGKVREDIPVNTSGEFDLSGENTFSIAFNSKYVLETLRSIDGDNVTLELTSPVSPCVLKTYGSNNETYLVLPVRMVG